MPKITGNGGISIAKPKDAQEYDGYVMHEPRKLTPEEKRTADRKIAELRERVRKANSVKKGSLNEKTGY